MPSNTLAPHTLGVLGGAYGALERSTSPRLERVSSQTRHKYWPSPVVHMPHRESKLAYRTWPDPEAESRVVTDQVNEILGGDHKKLSRVRYFSFFFCGNNILT